MPRRLQRWAGPDLNPSPAWLAPVVAAARAQRAMCKFSLRVANKVQKKQFLERIEAPEKNWKFSASDAKEREYWDDYMEAYQDMIRNTATKAAPWYVVPADDWFTRVVVAAPVIKALASLDLKYSKVSDSNLKELAAAKRGLQAGVTTITRGPQLAAEPDPA